MGWVVRVAHNAACEECGIHIPLHNSRPVTQHMPPLTERLLCENSGGVVVLRHFQRPGVQINQLAASTFSLATQLFDEHSGCSDFHALAIILLEGEVRQGFGLDNITQPENLVCKLTMGAFALSRQLAFTSAYSVRIAV